MTPSIFSWSIGMFVKVLDGVRAIEAQAASEAQALAEAEPIRLQKRQELWWQDALKTT